MLLHSSLSLSEFLLFFHYVCRGDDSSTGDSFGREERLGSVIRPALMNEGNGAPLPTGGLVPTAYVSDYGHWNSETSLTQTLTGYKFTLVSNLMWISPLSLIPIQTVLMWTVCDTDSSQLQDQRAGWRVPGHSNREMAFSAGWSKCCLMERVLLCGAVPVQSFKPGSVPEGAGPNQVAGCQMNHSAQTTRLIYLHF